jgi:hypothetical protein
VCPPKEAKFRGNGMSTEINISAWFELWTGKIWHLVLPFGDFWISIKHLTLSWLFYVLLYKCIISNHFHDSQKECIFPSQGMSLYVVASNPHCHSPHRRISSRQEPSHRTLSLFSHSLSQSN